jgi:DNA-binding response OmpR family regulator
MANILVVEDDKDLNTAYKIILENEGHQVVSVFNGKEELKGLYSFIQTIMMLYYIKPLKRGL